MRLALRAVALKNRSHLKIQILQHFIPYYKIMQK